MNVYLLNQYPGNMEWTKEKLKGTCIEIKNVNQSNRILKFYQSFGYFEHTRQNWECPRDMVGAFIGPSRLSLNDIVHIYWPDSISGLQIIKLPVTPRRKFPREMMVSMDEIEWKKRTVIMKSKTFYPYIALAHPNKINDEKSISLMTWKYAKEIDDSTAS